MENLPSYLPPNSTQVATINKCALFSASPLYVSGQSGLPVKVGSKTDLTMTVCDVKLAFLNWLTTSIKLHHQFSY
jgi:hypothetical protein